MTNRIPVDMSARKAGNKEEPRILVANHCSAFDGFIMLWVFGVTLAAKDDLRKLPIIGKLGDACDMIWIDR